MTAFIGRSKTPRRIGLARGRQPQIVYRRAGGDADRARAFANELTEMQLDLIFAATTPAATALMQETRTLPIVFVQVSDPIGSGFIASFARPGGNITGFTNIKSSLGASGWSSLRRSRPPSGV